jgi:isopentenyl diphosphate isomerase/L-lactate dehydrogenase-like FMN-dependent dehydrogenase
MAIFQEGARFMGPINLHDYEKLARERVERTAWDYYEGGSDDEVTLRANRSAFARLWLRPHVLVDVSACDPRTTVLGIPVSMPVLIAPTGGQGLAHPAGECATARAAGAAGTLMVASTDATCSLEDIAAAATAPLWFQLYIDTLEQARSLITRAEATGYRAIVLTVDTPRLSRRERDIRNDLKAYNVANFGGKAFIGNNASSERSNYIGHTLTWDILDWLRSLTALPLIVKGVLRADDAQLAVEHGVAGIIVSNHGGRQLDGALSSIEALPEVVAAVDGRCEVYLDGGIRRGTDVLKALALGARAVLIGRPVLWGLAVNGQEGVRHVLELLHAEFELAMALAGCPTLASIDRSLVRFRQDFL